jgi:hypothetical protein
MAWRDDPCFDLLPSTLEFCRYKHLIILHCWSQPAPLLALASRPLSVARPRMLTRVDASEVAGQDQAFREVVQNVIHGAE